MDIIELAVPACDASNSRHSVRKNGRILQAGLVLYGSSLTPHPLGATDAQASLYADSSLKGLVPVDEIPLCHCNVENGCDGDCIK